MGPPHHADPVAKTMPRPRPRHAATIDHRPVTGDQTLGGVDNVTVYTTCLYVLAQEEGEDDGDQQRRGTRSGTGARSQPVSAAAVSRGHRDMADR